MISKFEGKTLQILAQGNWTSARNIEITAFERYFEAQDQYASAEVRKFLSSFGGIKLNIPNPKSDTIMNSVLIDPIEGSYSMSRERLKKVEHKLEKKLCIVGIVDESSTLVVSETNEVYSLFDALVFLEGYSLEEAINKMCNAVAGIQVSFEND